MIPEFLLDGPAAKCAELPDPDVMFLPGYGDSVPPAIEEMCLDCPLFVACFAYALRVPVEGIWAATTFKQRRRLNPKLRAQLLVGEFISPEIRSESASKTQRARHAKVAMA